MLADTATDLCPRPLSQDDATALIGVLAVLQGHVLSHELDGDVAARLRRRVGVDGGDAELEAALDNLDQRLRHALEEYDEL
ncbi:hypothetical protein [Kineococcus aurantiacus]|uniref:Uncharacterized protein n=1 Tax=Kineococcus aurantiacus TaxID=37633 RepID=A0A7Y9DL44_9ACTN|nr:hypothetical protein [Kineococcus aurantiacus]NYD22603.1 hypothetical protein [Kineococcus aurantiacus]